MCFDEQELLAILAELVRELHHRKKLFASAGLPNIDQYNAETGADLRRLIFACDEVAEVLDRTGLSKEQKELVNQSQIGSGFRHSLDPGNPTPGCQPAQRANPQQLKLPYLRQGGQHFISTDFR